MQKGAVAKVYRYTTNTYRYMQAGYGKKGFLIPFFAPFDISNPLHSLQSQTLTLFALSHKQPQVCLLLPVFPSLKPGFFCIHRTDVVSLLQFLEIIFVLFIIIHGLVRVVLVGGFLYLVVWGFSRWYGEEISV